MDTFNSTQPQAGAPKPPAPVEKVIELPNDKARENTPYRRIPNWQTENLDSSEGPSQHCPRPHRRRECGRRVHHERRRMILWPGQRHYRDPPHLPITGTGNDAHLQRSGSPDRPGPLSALEDLRDRVEALEHTEAGILERASRCQPERNDIQDHILRNLETSPAAPLDPGPAVWWLTCSEESRRPCRPGGVRRGTLVPVRNP